jgi:hypothetical protein
VISLTEVQGLIGQWWYAYDEGDFATLTTLLTEDVHFECESDTGETSYEEFIRCDRQGREAVMEWQTEHRTASPYPLRHNGTNIHLAGSTSTEARFASYIFVSQIVEGQVSLLSTGLVRGTVRKVGDRLGIAEMRVTLDTKDSVSLAQHLADAAV